MPDILSLIWKCVSPSSSVGGNILGNPVFYMAKYELVWKNCVVSDGDYIVSFVIDV